MLDHVGSKITETLMSRDAFGQVERRLPRIVWPVSTVCAGGVLTMAAFA